MPAVDSRLLFVCVCVYVCVCIILKTLRASFLKPERMTAFWACRPVLLQLRFVLFPDFVAVCHPNHRALESLRTTGRPEEVVRAESKSWHPNSIQLEMRTKQLSQGRVAPADLHFPALTLIPELFGTAAVLHRRSMRLGGTSIDPVP